jgi:hypothetical protein
MPQRTKSLKVAYFLLAFLGLQGAHQFYLGNWKRGLLIAVFCHAPIFWFAYLNDQSLASGEPIELLPSLIIFFGLLTGLGLFLWDVFTLPKQWSSGSPVSPDQTTSTPQ